MKLYLFCSQHGTLAAPCAAILNLLPKRCKRGQGPCPKVDEQLLKILEELKKNAELEETCMTCKLQKSKD